jgi:hypothetical protein
VKKYRRFKKMSEETEDPFQRMENINENLVTLTDEDITGQRVIDLINQSTRPPATGTEQLLSNELAIGMLSPPLEKIRHICEAVMVIKEDELEDYKMDGLLKEAKKIHTICIALSNHYETIQWDEYNNEMPMVKLAFPFHESQAFEYLDEWTRELPYESYVIEGSQATFSIMKAKARFMKNLRETEISELKVDQVLELKAVYMYWLLRDGFKVESYRMIQSAFIAWAMPKVAQYLNNLMGTIKPESFKEALKNLTGGRGIQQISRRIRS